MSNKDTLLAVWDEFGVEGTGEVIDRYYHEDYVRHSERDTGRDGFKKILLDLQVGFPDLRTTTADLVEEGDRVAYRWESTGTHLGPYLGAPATGRTVTARGITISRLVDGLVVEDWASWNEVSVLHSLGILPIDR